MHPEDLAEAEELLQRSMKQRTKFECQFRVRRHDGTIKHVHASAVVHTDPATGETRIIGVNADVTDQKNAEERLSLAVKAASIGLWDWDVSTNRVWFSDTFYTMLGYEPGELPMSLKTWKELCEPDDYRGSNE